MAKQNKPWEKTYESGVKYTDWFATPVTARYDHEKRFAADWFKRRDEQFESLGNSIYEKSIGSHKEEISKSMSDKEFSIWESTQKEEIKKGLINQSIKNIEKIKIHDPNFATNAWRYQDYRGLYSGGEIALTNEARRSTLSHELFHGSGLQGIGAYKEMVERFKGGSAKYKNWLYERKDENPNRLRFYNSSGEIGARISEIRNNMQLLPEEKVTKEMLEERFPKSSIRERNKNELFDMFEDETIIDMLNSLVQADTKSNGIYNLSVT